MGLVKAITMFDPDRGVRFICYAVWWIKAYIKNYIYKSYQTKTGTLSHAKGLISLDCCLSKDPDEEYKLLDHVLDETPDQEHSYISKERQIFLMNIISSEPRVLSNREIFILKERFFADATLKDIASKIGVTRERVRQIEARSLQRIRDFIETKHAMLFDDIIDSTTLKMKRGRV
jgi:RNA polymerase sigma-32 factor